MRVTIREVAREAGVSVSTASRALNRKGEIAPEKRTHIFETARRLGYTPSFAAQALVLGKTRTLGAVITDNTSPVYAEALRGVQDVATSTGLGLLFCNSADSQDEALRCLALLRSKQVDGVLLAPVQTDRRDIEELNRFGVPFVFMFRHFPDLPGTDYVVTDNVEGGRLVTEHLLALGHARIGHIGGPPHTSTARDRLAGYRLAHRSRGLAEDGDLVLPAPYTVAGGFDAGTRLLRREDRPSAVFAACDMQAVGVLRAAALLGLRVPDDVSVVGGDDIELAEFVRVPLTTFRQPARDIGKTAAELLVAKVSDHPPPARQVVVTPTLIVRQSSARRR